MSNSDPQIKLREMQPSDSAAVASLVSALDTDMTTRFLMDPYTAITSGNKFATVGVVVESAGFDGLIGMGTVRFSEVQYNGEILPLAFLDGLKVRNDFRRRGLGYQIASWRVQRARELYGDRCVIATGMVYDNHASRAVAKKWCREFLDPAMVVRIRPTRTRQPKPLAGMTVRDIAPTEYEEYSDKRNTFYENYNLCERLDPGSIAELLAVSPEGRKPYRLFVAVDSAGNLLAGAQTWARGMLVSDTISNPPVPMRVLNSLLHILPSDFIIRDVAVSGIWYQPGHIEAARYLWEMIRWKCNEQGNTITTGFDPGDPARESVILKPWHQPRIKVTMAVHGPSPIDRSRLVAPPGRV